MRMSHPIGHLAPPQRQAQLADTAGELHVFEGLPLAVVSTSAGMLVVPTLDNGESRARAGDGAAIAMWASAGSDEVQWTRFRDDPLHTESPLTVDQTNESVILDERAILKWQLFATESVAATKEQLLHAANFENTPGLWGHLWWGSEKLIASVVEYVPDTQDGWTWAADALGRGEFEWASVVGEITAHMHAALARGGHGVYDDTSAPARDLVGARTQLIHGDFHVGQVLRREDQFFVIDFDGDPLKSASENFELQSPLLDVVSMSCSIIHAGMVAIKRGAEQAAVYETITRARSAFLSAYQANASHANFSSETFSTLVDQVEQREIAYAEQYLPRWLYAPRGAVEYLRTVDGR